MAKNNTQKSADKTAPAKSKFKTPELEQNCPKCTNTVCKGAQQSMGIVAPAPCNGFKE